MEEGYRIPDISEFKQGFEFELRHDYKFGLLDLATNELTNEVRSSVWSDCKVWWMHEPNEMVTEEIDGYKISVTGATLNFGKPFDEKSFLEQGLIRVKI